MSASSSTTSIRHFSCSPFLGGSSRRSTRPATPMSVFSFSGRPMRAARRPRDGCPRGSCRRVSSTILRTMASLRPVPRALVVTWGIEHLRDQLARENRPVVLDDHLGGLDLVAARQSRLDADLAVGVLLRGPSTALVSRLPAAGAGGSGRRPACQVRGPSPTRSQAPRPASCARYRSVTSVTSLFRPSEGHLDARRAYR